MATPAGKAGQSRPWTERSEGSGSAPPAESATRSGNLTTLMFYLCLKIKKTIGNSKSLEFIFSLKVSVF
ncbi:Uncharacterised protein [Mycobacteroides abscessus subsp. abscessus]|nr:Uncharacterised protein [Mycobacteroides abscessus subsp. abscessus]